MFLCAFSPAQPAGLFPVLCFKAGVCVIHSKWHMCALSCCRLFAGRSVAQTRPWSLPLRASPPPRGSDHVSTHLGLPKMSGVCHNEKSVNLFTCTLCSSVGIWVNKYFCLWIIVHLPKGDFFRKVGAYWPERRWEIWGRACWRAGGSSLGDRHLALQLSAPRLELHLPVPWR